MRRLLLAEFHQGVTMLIRLPIGINPLWIVHAPIGAQDRGVHFANVLIHGDVELFGDLLLSTPETIQGFDGMNMIVFGKIQRWVEAREIIENHLIILTDHSSPARSIVMPTGLTLGMTSLDLIHPGLAREFWLGRAEAVTRAKSFWPKPPEDYGRRRPKGD